MSITLHYTYAIFSENFCLIFPNFHKYLKKISVKIILEDYKILLFGIITNF